VAAEHTNAMAAVEDLAIPAAVASFVSSVPAANSLVVTFRVMGNQVGKTWKRADAIALD
jgi:hypothetical protein